MSTTATRDRFAPIPYIARNGRKRFKPSWPALEDALQRSETGLDNPGFCLACGQEADGCEPDMQRGECESCGEACVFGATELLLRGLHGKAED